MWSSDYEETIDFHDRCLNIGKEVGDRTGEGRQYQKIGCTHHGNLGKFKTAIEHYELGVQIAKEVGDKPAEQIAYRNLGKEYYSLGDFKTAVLYHGLRLKIAKEMGDRTDEGGAYGSLGNAYFQLHDFKKSIEYHELCLNVYSEVGDRVSEGRTYGNLGDAYKRLGNLPRAIDCLENCLQIAKEVGDRAQEGKVYRCLGIAYDGLGSLKKAIACSELCLKIAKEVGDKAEEGNAYENLGTAYCKLGDFKLAMGYLELRLEIAKQVGDSNAEGITYGNIGNVCFNLGHIQKSIDYFELCLKIATEVEDRAAQGKTYCNLGNAYNSLGDFKRAIEYHTLDLNISKQLGDMDGKGRAYGNLGTNYYRVGRLKEAIENHELHLEIAKELGDRDSEGRVYGNLGNDCRSLGNFKKAKYYYDLNLKIAKEVGARSVEGGVYANLGIVYRHLRDFKKAIENYKLHLTITKEVGDRPGEGRAYGNLGLAYHDLGDFEKALEYHDLCLKIAREVGDRAGEGYAYGNIGNTYTALDNLKQSLHCHECHLEIAKEVGDKIGEGIAYFHVGLDFESMGSLCEAVDRFTSSVKILNDARMRLQSKDEWKIDLRNVYRKVYIGLWRVLINQGKTVEALFAAEQGRAQALKDLMESKYGYHMAHIGSSTQKAETIDGILNCFSSNIVFTAINNETMFSWVCQKGSEVHLRKITNSDYNSYSLVEVARKAIGVRTGIKCEDRSLGKLSEEEVANERCDQAQSGSLNLQENPALRKLYDLTISPIIELIHGDELVIVPEGRLWLAPYAAFMDSNSKYLCETFRIRVIPSLTALKLIADCPADYHCKTGALLVGDPWVQQVIFDEGQNLQQLPYARVEVETIGQILNTAPLIGREATKEEVLKRLSSVALVHIAAHGRMETGEIALCPNPSRESQIPRKEDYLLTMSDVLDVKLRAKLVVLSCCHSGRGKIKAEGVVGIARAFLGAGARSVLVSLWAIDDEATLEFMKNFYQHLLDGTSASKALNRAMKHMRESDKFGEVKYWAPFVLIGDDITLGFRGGSD